MQLNGRNRALNVTAGGKGLLVRHAGAVLLRKAADRLGLTAAPWTWPEPRACSAASPGPGRRPATTPGASSIASSSGKEGAAATWKKGCGSRRLAAWCARLGNELENSR